MTEADFRATYDAYLKRPEELKKVYQNVLNDLQQPFSMAPPTAA